YFAEIRSEEEMHEALCCCQREGIPFLIVGKGSNSLFDDAGFSGAVLLNRIDFCHWNEKEVRVGAGFSFSYLGMLAAKKDLSGLEFASGIPATVGGAIWMNAGAQGQETSETLTAVRFLHSEGEMREFVKEELHFGYRTSSFQSMPGAIVSATFKLSPLHSARQTQLKLLEKRKATQPLQEKSAGCIFRNPGVGLSAGALIEKSGLKGVFVGGAFVSELHANFIVNRLNATSCDVKELIAVIRKKVYEETGVHLETEIRVVGHGISS
ncbi:MAG TPA: UDP-N-acetylmuramate dehydrogenase, partial [Chlamydiales bacterium]|nr:UDP-N-acetylmuramate dehydrogenase [Chlamydiales bacterium]